MFEPLASGAILWERYKITNLVARGGQGSIYKAEDLRLDGRLCAIKEMVPDSEATAEHQSQIQEQFHREASILARLDHPNLPKVSDFFVDNERDYLVMDFVDGQDLREVIEAMRVKKKFITEQQALDWAGQILDALDYLHAQEPPILHRDIKPANLKLTKNGSLKLVDFGLVKVMAPDDNRTVTVLQGKGTVQYTPLEQYGGDTGHTDVRSDIYSLGATLYHLLTLTPPLEAKERFLYPAHEMSIRDINPSVSLRTERAILHALAMHPDERPTSARQVKEELQGRSIFNFGNSPVLPIEWQSALWANKTLTAIVAVLLTLAIIVTIFAPPLPPVP